MFAIIRKLGVSSYFLDNGVVSQAGKKCIADNLTGQKVKRHFTKQGHFFNNIYNVIASDVFEIDKAFKRNREKAKTKFQIFVFEMCFNRH